jgi:hypothetical protein
MAGIIDFILEDQPLAMRYLPMLRQFGLFAGDRGGDTVTAPSATGGSSRWENVARRMAMRRGYTPEEWRMLDYIIEHESGWNPNAANPTSSARGIPQAMMSVHFGENWQSNPAAQRFLQNPRVQIRWLLDYIANRYGSVENAYRHKLETGWY